MWDRKIIKTQIKHFWNDHRYIMIGTGIVLLVAIIL
jgi:hypothetical protein